MPITNFVSSKTPLLDLFAVALAISKRLELVHSEWLKNVKRNIPHGFEQLTLVRSDPVHGPDHFYRRD